jgi:hypothetical protein
MVNREIAPPAEFEASESGSIWMVALLAVLAATIAFAMFVISG